MTMVHIWNRNIWHIALSVIFVASCSKAGEPVVPSEDVQSMVSVSAGGPEDGPEVKAPVIGTKPSSFGMMLVEAGTYNSYQDFTSNVAVTARDNDIDINNTLWNFCYTGSRTWFKEFFFINKKDGSNNDVNVDVYAYAPFNGNLTPALLTAIPYTFDSQDDIMWADQNQAGFTFPGDGLSAAGYKNRDIHVNGEHKYVQFDFNHILSLIALQFKLKNTEHPYDDNSGSNATTYLLTGVRFTAKNGTVVKTGTMNALTGAFTKGEVNSGTFVKEWRGRESNPLLTISSGTEYSSPFYILVCPDSYIDPSHHYTDGDFTIELELYTQEKGYLPYSTVTINAADLGG
ncbi:MAG: fimbrillin family protein, partial [Bacteroidales bacterium]|nr:fimbrillin family protein [Bacteroidales bacterium]